MRKEKRKIYRPIPCPDYDIAGLESWLSDMAAQGWHLMSEGFFMGFAAFEKGKKQPVRYRLSAAAKQPGFFSDYRVPDEEEQEIAGEMGWEFMDFRGQFYVWRCADPSAPELNTDRSVQVLALNKAIERLRGSVIGGILAFLLFFAQMMLEHGVLTLLTSAASLFAVFTFAALLVVELSSLGALVHLTRLKRRLLSTGEFPAEKNWRKKLLPTWLRKAAYIIVIVLWLCLAFSSCEASDKNTVPLSEFEGEVPFATMADFAEGEYRLENYSFGNTYEKYSNFLTPLSIHWDEIAELRFADGTVLSGGLEVDYYEAAAPWLARQLAREYVWSKGPRGEKGEWLELEAYIDADYVAVFTGRSTHFPCAVIQKGGTVLCAHFYQTGSSQVSLDQWVSILAESIR